MLVNFCLAFQRFLYRPRVGLGPQMPVKTAHDARQCFPGVSAVPPPTARRFMAQDLGVLPKKQHRVLANFLFGVFRLCIRPRVGLGPQMPVKTEQNARDFCIGRFCGSDNDRIAQSDQ